MLIGGQIKDYLYDIVQKNTSEIIKPAMTKLSG